MPLASCSSANARGHLTSLFLRRVAPAIRTIGLAGVLCLTLPPAIAAEAPAPSANAHPFLLLREADLPALRAKAALPRFAPMVGQARELWNNDVPLGDWDAMIAVFNACALLHVVDGSAEARAGYRQKILATMALWPESVPLLGKDHRSTVRPSTALFNAIIALDVAHREFTAAELASAELHLAAPIAWFERDVMVWEKPIPWMLARIGLLTLYHTYRGDAEATRKWADTYHRHLTQISLMEDGSWNQSPAYGHARLNGGRSAKSAIIDVLQFNGLHDYYHEERMRGLMDWLNTFSLTPNGMPARFGESGSTRHYNDRNVLFYTMATYGERAGRMASWHLAGRDLPEKFPIGALSLLVLAPETPPEPLMPRSLLKPFSGAALWGRAGEREALAATLYSLRRQNFDEGGFHHTSEDVNSIGLTAYGALLVANAGTRYDPEYPGLTPDGGRWYEAWLQNVALIGDATRHPGKEGGGLLQGMTGGSIEYGLTDAGEALGNGHHQRVLALLHPLADDAPTGGFFVVIDQVVPSRPTDPVHLWHHPNTREGGVTTVTANTEFLAPANGYVNAHADGSEAVSVFFATPPDAIQTHAVWRASFEQNVLRADALRATYTGQPGRIVTVFYPQDRTHPKPPLHRLAGAGYTGARIVHGPQREDVVVAASTAAPAPCAADGFSFHGESAFVRRGPSASSPARALINGVSLHLDGSPARIITSDRPLSFALEGDALSVVCDAPAVLTIKGEPCRDVRLAGSGAPAAATIGADGTVTLPVPRAGRHSFILVRALATRP